MNNNEKTQAESCEEWCPHVSPPCNCCDCLREKQERPLKQVRSARTKEKYLIARDRWITCECGDKEHIPCEICSRFIKIMKLVDEINKIGG